MDRQPAGLPHIIVRGSGKNQTFKASGGGGSAKAREVIDRRAHGHRLKLEAQTALDDGEAVRRLLDEDLAELQATGSFITIEAADAEHLLVLDRLDSAAQKEAGRGWMLVSVGVAPDGTQHAVVWVRDSARPKFLERFEKYAVELTRKGKVPHQTLVANMGEIRRTVLADLWTSSAPTPATAQVGWWELWLRETDHEDATTVLRAFVEKRQLKIARARLRLDGVRVVWIQSSWGQLGELLFLDVPLVEIRAPQLIESFADLSAEEQREYTDDLAGRLRPAADSAPAVCLLDTGVDREHPLLATSLSPDDEHTVVSGAKRDLAGHGTAMAGLSLFGSTLADALDSSEEVVLSHQLESVKILPGQLNPQHDPLTYGVVTADAVAQPETTAPRRRRVFSLPVTAKGALQTDLATLWSATIDALAAGASVTRNGDDLELLTEPTDDAARLFVISAGNVDGFTLDAQTTCEKSPIEEPAQAQNALTVGAMTNLGEVPAHPDFQGWKPLAVEGDLSPHSRTSQTSPHPGLPIKPDICLEGGNVLTDGAEDFATPSSVSLLTTGLRRPVEQRDLALANATSAATAQAARLGAVVLADSPTLWPETVRALLVHSARWTERMQTRLHPHRHHKGDQAALLRAFGWGVPDEARLLRSTHSAATMIIEDSFVPFATKEHKVVRCRVHSLPWPREVLEQLGAETVRVRVTLSYFVEPNARRRGWKQRYAYASHGLRFRLQRPTETAAEFTDRVRGETTGSKNEDRWFVGSEARNTGSLHQDIWRGSGAELAQQNSIAISASGGWWKTNQRADRADRAVRYSLIVSVETDAQDVDLYTPILLQAQVMAGEIDV